MDKLILIVEDEVDMREALVAALEASGFRTIATDNGETGLELAQEHKPDLVLLDILMPIMTGQEMFRQLRAEPWGADMKVVMVTSLDDVGNIGTGFARGVNDYIIKSNTNLADIVKIAKDVCNSEN
ncbi:MAG: DNA-binding response OmpR family regulator [Acidimicrobiales bacterium]|jgi:DNA-binding response OmpR family regulator